MKKEEQLIKKLKKNESIMMCFIHYRNESTVAPKELRKCVSVVMAPYSTGCEVGCKRSAVTNQQIASQRVAINDPFTVQLITLRPDPGANCS